MQEVNKLKDRALAMPRSARLAAIVGAALLALGGVVALVLGGTQAGNYQVVFANLTPDDSAASADALRAAGIAFRVEAAGDAISVPSGKVHDARLLLASQGLPRAGGVGFELFDKSDLGVSEFTQRVNLQRAIEGELARTIGNRQKVHDARVHVTMPKRGLLRSEDKGASAAVMLRMEPGRTLDDKEIAGVRHLVAAAVPQLDNERVTIVDENGAMLGNQGNDAQGMRNTLEAELESRVVAILEPALGKGAVVARVTAEMDEAEEEKTESAYLPEQSALRTEQLRNEQQNVNNGGAAGLTGAAANDAAAATGGAPAAGTRGDARSSSVNQQYRTFEVSGTVTKRVARQPRLLKLSVAVLVDAKGKELPPEEIKKLTELAKRAVGYDEERGDLLELTATAFQLEAVPGDGTTGAAPAPLALPGGVPLWVGAAALGVMALGAVLVAFAVGRRKSRGAAGEGARLLAGAGALKISSSAAAEGGMAGTVELQQAARERARALAATSPDRAAMILEAWLDQSEAPPTAPTTPEARRG